MQEYISLVKTVQTIGLNVGDRYSFYVVPKLSDSTHFSENEGRPDASFDGRESRVSSEGCTGVISLPKGRKDPEPRR